MLEDVFSSELRLEGEGAKVAPICYECVQEGAIQTIRGRLRTRWLDLMACVYIYEARSCMESAISNRRLLFAPISH